MNHSQIAAVFNRTFNGQKNLLTPCIITYGKRGRHLYELSSGTGIDRSPLYGVTVIEIGHGKRGDISKSFHSRHDAEAYIRNDFCD